jgi:hypothetical protein
LRQEEAKFPIKSCLLLAGVLLSVLLFAQGYVFGYGDLEEMNSIAMNMADPTLFSKDLFVQDALLMGINHRSFSAFLISFLGLSLIPWLAFLWFLFSAVLLLTGLIKLVSTTTQKPVIIFLALLATCLITYDLNLGGHDLYSNGFGGALLAEGLLAWAWYFLIRQQYIQMSLLSVAATLAHPLEGVQFFAISSALLFWLSFSKDRLPKAWWLSLPIYVFTAGIYVLFTHLAVSEGQEDVQAHIDMAYYFRNPHHFDFLSFSKKGALLMLLLMALGLPALWKQNKLLAKACIIVVLGMLVYTIGTLGFRLHLVFNTEWFRTNIWLKLFLIMALVKRLDPYIPEKWSRLKQSHAIPFLALFLISLFYPVAEDRQFPWLGTQRKSQEIALEAKNVLPIDALVLFPLSVNDFRCFSERSGYVGMKAMPVRKEGMRMWYKRVNMAFGQHLGTGLWGFKMVPSADQFLRQLTYQELMKLKKDGVTHLLTFAEVNYPGLRKLAFNSAYVLYEL